MKTFLNHFTRPPSHPLQEQAVATFVSNSARLVGGAGSGSSFTGYQQDQQQTENQQYISGVTTWNSIVVCTGANACGKVSHLDFLIPCFLMFSKECLFKAGTSTLFVRNAKLPTEFTDCHHSNHEPDRMVRLSASFCFHLTCMTASCLLSLLHLALWIRSLRAYKLESRFQRLFYYLIHVNCSRPFLF